MCSLASRSAPQPFSLLRTSGITLNALSPITEGHPCRPESASWRLLFAVDSTTGAKPQPTGTACVLPELTSVSEMGEGTGGGRGACSEVPGAVGITEQSGPGCSENRIGWPPAARNTRKNGLGSSARPEALPDPALGLWVLAPRWWEGPQHLRPSPRVHAERLCAAC